MSQALPPISASPQAEVQAIADEMAKAYKNMVSYYIRECGLNRKEALEQAESESQGEYWKERLEQMPSQQISWYDLSHFREEDEPRGWQKWETIKAEACVWYETGQVSAESLADKSPWHRGKYFAIRNSLEEGWQPRDGIEKCLLDQMAICFVRFLEWQSALTRWSNYTEFYQEKEKLPRVTTQEAVAHSAEMIDRFNRMFLRTLRALRDLRRYNAPVIVQNAGQVNVGAQQVNVSEPPKETSV